MGDPWRLGQALPKDVQASPAAGGDAPGAAPRGVPRKRARSKNGARRRPRRDVSRVDVVIIGGGPAGIMAAVDLVERGFDVLLLEARERLGGRVATLHDPRVEVPIELGAEFLHTGSEVVADIAHEARLRLAEHSGESWLRAGRHPHLRPLRDFDDRVEEGMRRAFRGLGAHEDRSIGECLRAASLTPLTRALTLAFAQGFQAASADDLSARALQRDDTKAAGRAFRLLDGYDGLIRHLATKIDGRMRLGTRVRHVRWGEGRVDVTARTARGEDVEVRARAMVVAVPLAILQGDERDEGALVFEPPLPASHTARETIGLGQVTKLTLRFRSAIWQTARVTGAPATALDRTSFLFAPHRPFPVFWTPRPVVAPVLVAWAGGPAHDALRDVASDRVVAIALEGLAETTGLRESHVKREFELAHTHDWESDDLARGAYSHLRVGGADAPQKARRPLRRTLFFAGEHTCDVPDNGTVHGAVESGRRAARAVEKVFGDVRPTRRAR